ncbi:MAG: energy transducer TonB [Thermoanaerobaculia bacterium]|nr:MAG: energy transducer TonB [Thermoanaerobaculia bacterium]
MRRLPAAAADQILVLVFVLCAIPEPARATQGVASYKHELKKIEDHLRAGEWQPAKDSSDRLLKDLIQEYSRGKGSRPLFGLTLAFRGIAESGLGDLVAATWDWTAAGLVSPESTQFDPSRFGAAGRALHDGAGWPVEAKHLSTYEGVQDGLVPPKKASGEHPVYSLTSREAGFEGTVSVQMVIDASGRPAAVIRLDAKALNEHTAVVVSTLETIRSWRFEPATFDGVPVNVYWDLTVSYRLERGPH